MDSSRLNDHLLEIHRNRDGRSVIEMDSLLILLAPFVFHRSPYLPLLVAWPARKTYNSMLKPGLVVYSTRELTWKMGLKIKSGSSLDPVSRLL